mgnify:FL=1
MRLLSIGILLLAFTLSHAQNKNTKDESKTNDTEINKNKGKNNKEEKVPQVDNGKDLKSNRDVKNNPSINNESSNNSQNSKAKNKDKDRSANYLMKGKKYKIIAEPRGYAVVSEKNKNYARIRQTSNNTYIFTRKNKTSYGHFDENDHLILETYDHKKDVFIVEKFTIIR